VRLLGEHFLACYAADRKLPAPTLQEASWRLLDAYAWPGNVRELQNVIERLVILSPGANVGPKDLPLEMTRGISNPSGSSPAAGANSHLGLPLREELEAIERDRIQAALDRHKGNVARAAADLGLERSRLHKRIKALGLSGE
jgi:two-component system nitrogen regulation response regulator NtrX